MRRNGIELYNDNAQHLASMVSKHGWSLDHVAREVFNEAKVAAEPYRKSVGDSYVDHFKIAKTLYKGPQHHPKHPVYDRLVGNDDPAAHIIEGGIVQDVLQIGDREQEVTEFQRGHWFLAGAAARVAHGKLPSRPAPSEREANWDDDYANEYVDESGGSGARQDTDAARAVKKRTKE